MKGPLRLTVYITGALSAAAMLFAALGWGSYDAEAGTFDLHPIQIEYVSGLAVSGLSSVMAIVAYLRGWRRGE